MTPLNNLSVFFPAYNEEANIEATVLGAIKVLPHIAHKYQVNVINDGSSDRTAAIVAKLSRQYPAIKLINHSTNRGYGAAIKTGLTTAQYDWICYTDSDGQFYFHEINKFLPFVSQADLIIGHRVYRTDNPIRRLLALMLRVWDTLLFGLNLKDVDCGFKLIKKQVVTTIGPLVTQSAITETEFMVRAQRAGFTIVEVGVTHHARPEGIQTGAKFKVILKAFTESLKLWWHLLLNPAVTR